MVVTRYALYTEKIGKEQERKGAKKRKKEEAKSTRVPLFFLRAAHPNDKQWTGAAVVPDKQPSFANHHLAIIRVIRSIKRAVCPRRAPGRLFVPPLSIVGTLSSLPEHEPRQLTVPKQQAQARVQ